VGQRRLTHLPTLPTGKSYSSDDFGLRVPFADESITVSQRRHWKTSRRLLSGCDCLPIIATPHNGQRFGAGDTLLLDGMTNCNCSTFRSGALLGVLNTQA